MTDIFDPTDLILAVGRGQLDDDPTALGAACAALSHVVEEMMGQPLKGGAKHIAKVCRDLAYGIDTGLLPDPRTVPNETAALAAYDQYAAAIR